MDLREVQMKKLTFLCLLLIALSSVIFGQTEPASAQHKTDVYGYLLAPVPTDGTIRAEFKQINESDVTESTRGDYKDEFIRSCFAGDSSPYVSAGSTCPAK
jgi:hypothetical protein